MRIVKYPEKSNWNKILARPVLSQGKIGDIIKPIIKRVKTHGDKALIAFAKEFDQVELNELIVSPQEFDEAMKRVSPDLKEAIKIAKANIEKFHEAQVTEPIEVETMPGVVCSRKSVPIKKVGLYVPGGTAPLFSTVLMLGIPAKIAGCKKIVMCTPSDREGKVNPVILWTAQLIGIDKVIKVGGAQAIAAMAYGTESVPKVFKIFGPGNQYVTAAKQQVGKCGVAIDMPAGPSEVLVYADETAEPSFVAADLLSQAEHGVDSQSVLISTDEKMIDDTMLAIKEQLEVLPRKDIASKSLDNSIAILVDDQKTALKMINRYAPEHLILAIENDDEVAAKIKNAGSVFLGNYTPESAGDYASGTNHTLPTNGYATAYSGVSVDSFVKKITFQKISEKGIKNIGNTIEMMAEAEQLMAHKNAVSLRLAKLKK